MYTCLFLLRTIIRKKTQEFHKNENDLIDASLDSLQWDFRP